MVDCASPARSPPIGLVTHRPVPTVAALGIGRRHRNTAIATIVSSYWITADFAADQLTVVKYFGAQLLLIPLLLILPHVTRKVFAAPTAGTGLAIAAVVTIARLRPQLQAGQDASNNVADFIVVGVIAICSAVVLLLAGTNYTALVDAADALEAPRSFVRTSERARRNMECDLHDGTRSACYLQHCE